MPALLSIIFAALLPTAYVDKIPEDVKTEPLITIAEARARLIANSGKRIFFRTKGTIIADKDGYRKYFILLDGSAATQVICSSDDKWQVGDEIIAVCTAMQPQFQNPTLLSESLQITVLSHQPPSAPSFIQPRDLIGHRNDFNTVKIAGTVVDAFLDDVNPEWSILILAQDDVRTKVWSRTEDIRRHDLAKLIDAELEITGIVLPDLSNFYRARGPWVLASSADSIRITRPQPDNPFAATSVAPHRETKSGRVVANWKDDSFFLATDRDERIRVRLMKGQSLPETGSQVSVAGFLRHNEICTRLANAVCRVDGLGGDLDRPVDAEPIALPTNESGEPHINAKLTGRTIRLTGKVKEVHSIGTPDAAVTISRGQSVCNLLIGPRTQPPPIGSVIAATGVCIVEDTLDMDTETVRAAQFALALRSPTDLTVLNMPPWWTPAKLFTLIIILAALLLAILIWNAALRKLVTRRGKALADETIRTASANLRLEERTRLAVELHDTIAQNLTGASFEIKTAAKLADTDRAKMKTHIDIVDRTLKSCRDEIRNCIWDLRTNSLDQKDFNESIRLAIEPHTGDTAIQIRFNVERSRISESVLHATMRIIRELTINAVRHGGASQVKIAGCIDGDKILFSVQDDGCGFDPNAVPSAQQGHFGLQGIRERLHKLGGDMRIESRRGNGSRVAVSINLHPTSNDPQS